MTFRVRFAPEAESQLATIEAYIANASGSPVIAANYVEAIIDHCERFTLFPQRGTRRDDLFPGLRVTHYRGSAVIAFTLDLDAETVSIVGVFYGGQNYEATMKPSIGERGNRQR